MRYCELCYRGRRSEPRRAELPEHRHTEQAGISRLVFGAAIKDCGFLPARNVQLQLSSLRELFRRHPGFAQRIRENPAAEAPKNAEGREKIVRRPFFSLRTLGVCGEDHSDTEVLRGKRLAADRSVA
jgi:hypothetical protein